MAIACLAAMLLFAPQALAAEADQDLEAGSLATQSANHSDYAIFKSDGFVYPCDANGNVTSQYWTTGTLTGNHNDAVSALNGVKVLYIDSDVTDVDAGTSPKAKYQYSQFGKTHDAVQEMGFDGDWATSGHTVNVERIVFLTDDTGKSQVTNLGGRCFRKLSSLESVENLDKTQVRSIPQYCFQDDERLGSITLPNTCTEINNGAFSGCKRLKTVNFGTSLQRVKDNAFMNCTLLSSVELPASFSLFEGSSFKGCSNLTKVVLNKADGTVSADGNGYSVFSGTPIAQSDGEGLVYVPRALLADYKSDDKTNDWKKLKDKIVAIGGDSPQPGSDPQPTPTPAPSEDLSQYAGKAKAAGFTDLKASDWYMKVPDGAFQNSKTLFIDYAIAKGLMSGYAGTKKFGPHDNVSRAMAATVIYRMATGKTAANTDNNVSTKFSDVPSKQWYSAAVKWCSDNGVVTGYSGTTKFDPNGNVTREQLAAMVSRYCIKVKGMKSAGTDVSKFKDGAQVNAWACEGVAFCSANGIVSGVGTTGRFDPQGLATRCQASKIFAATAYMAG